MGPIALAGPEPIARDTSKEVRQELPPNPFSWQGFYIGLNLGGTFGETEANDTREYTNFTFVNNEHAESWRYDTAGFTGGIQWGYLWQCGHFVYGVETDIGFLDVDGDGTLNGDEVDANSSTSSNFYWSTRARFGWAFNRLLLYATGGSITVNYDMSVSGLPGDQDSKAELRPGWIGGGGIEYAFNDRWSIKAEYLYFELENGTMDLHSTRSVGGDSDVFQFDHQSYGHIVRLGVNYHFGEAHRASEMTSTGYNKDGKTMAQPVAVEQPFTWSGLYVGAHFGDSWGDVDWTDEPDEANEIVGRFDQDGFFGGIHLGMNTQWWGWLVIGNEWKFSLSDIDGGTDRARTDFDKAETNIDWVASSALRVGVAIPRFFDGRILLYGKVGLSDAHVEWDGRLDVVSDGHFDTEENRFAPVFGGGVEVAVTRHWTVRVEYDRADYGTKIIRGNRHGTFANESEQYQTNFKLSTVEGAISYKF